MDCCSAVVCDSSCATKNLVDHMPPRYARCRYCGHFPMC